MLGLPFENPEASLRTVREYADHPGVIGFLVTSQRSVGVHRNEYMPLYAELQARGMPLGFHAGPNQNDTMTSTMNRFLSAHAISFVTCNMTHMTNWVINGMGERFPNLKVIWIESGLAWVPFMMQRLDHEYQLRQSDAPLLTKMPATTCARCTTPPSRWRSPTSACWRAPSAPSTRAHPALLLRLAHWDFDVPGRIMTIPFLTEQAKRNILANPPANSSTSDRDVRRACSRSRDVARVLVRLPVAVRSRVVTGPGRPSPIGCPSNEMNRHDAAGRGRREQLAAARMSAPGASRARP